MNSPDLSIIQNSESGLAVSSKSCFHKNPVPKCGETKWALFVIG